VRDFSIKLKPGVYAIRDILDPVLEQENYAGSAGAAAPHDG
jgi:hypothetical protein